MAILPFRSFIKSTVNIPVGHCAISFLKRKDDRDAYIITETFTPDQQFIMKRTKFVRVSDKSNEGKVTWKECTPNDLLADNKKYVYQIWQLPNERLSFLESKTAENLPKIFRYIDKLPEQSSKVCASQMCDTSYALVRGKIYSPLSFTEEMITWIGPYLGTDKAFVELAIDKNCVFPPVPNLPNISELELKLGKQIAKGGMGIIFLAACKRYSGNVVVKQILTQFQESTGASAASTEDIIDFKKEAQIMYTLRHPSLIELWGISNIEGKLSIIMPYMENGSLDRLLKNHLPDFSWDNANKNTPGRLPVINDIFLGLWHLHTNNIIHRDIKSPNVLLDKDWHAKLSDFGTAYTLTASFQQITKKEDSMATKTQQSSTSNEVDKKIPLVGTLQWLAPEIHHGKREYSFEIDIYSLGILLWEISEKQFAGFLGEFMACIPDNRPAMASEQYYPPGISKLIRSCWAENPAERPKIQKVVEDFSDICETYRSSL